MIVHSSSVYGRRSKNLLEEAHEPGFDGARALVESFYHAFNQRDMAVFEKVWAEHALIQLNNPLGGILRGYEGISTLYRRVFSGPASVWVELSDIVEYRTEGMVVFAGRENGEFSGNGTVLPLSIRTSRIIQWLGREKGWRQVHHHGSIDDPTLLSAYQGAVR